MIETRVTTRKENAEMGEKAMTKGGRTSSLVKFKFYSTVVIDSTGIGSARELEV